MIEVDASTDAVARRCVNAAITVHRSLGPGLLENAYEHCLAFELADQGLEVQRQVALPVVYRDTRLDAGYRLDLVISGKVIIEVKAVEALTRLHEAQLITYLKLSGLHVGLLMNFNTVLLKDGLKRLVA